MSIIFEYNLDDDEGNIMYIEWIYIYVRMLKWGDYVLWQKRLICNFMDFIQTTILMSIRIKQRANQTAIAIQEPSDRVESIPFHSILFSPIRIARFGWGSRQ